MKAGVFYFSGTGNTRLVANMIRDELTGRGWSVDLVRIEDVLKGNAKAEAESYDIIGIGCPVIGFAAPALVTRFVRTLPKADGRKAFVFRTAGGVAPINYNASKPLIRMLARRGYDVFHERVFSIGSNWITKFDDGIVVRLHAATEKKVGLMCDALVRGKRRILKTGFGLKLAMECVMHTTPSFFHLVGKDFKVSDACTRCGLCISNCPAGNILEKGGKIRFGFKCNSCLRCMYACPTHAIHLQKFASFEVPGGYNISKILAHPEPAGDTASKPAPRFFEAYLADDVL